MSASGQQELFAVVPLKECPHTCEIGAVPDGKVSVAAPCLTCENVGENWVCLTCYKVYCGRHVSGHAVAHATETNHHMSLGFVDLSVWCYACESYVDNAAAAPAKAAAYENKFNEKMP